MKKSEIKLKNFALANKRLREAVTAYKSEKDNTLYRDAVIQRFEFTYELAWKTLSEILREHGIVLDILSPKTVFKAAYGAGYIKNEALWLKIIEDRNSMSHTYDEETATQIAIEICNRYGKEFSALLNALSD